MRLIILLSMLSLGCSCAPAPKGLQFEGAAQSFSVVEKNPFQGKPVVEASLLNMGGEVVAFYDLGWSGSMHRASLGSQATDFRGGELVSAEARFQYTLEHDGKLYTFALSYGDVYLTESTDGGLTWNPANGDEPVLTHSPDPASIYHQLWNVGVAIDDQGVWHLLVESADALPEQRSVGLAYSTAQMVDGRIEFNTNRSATHVVRGGGNPWLTFIPGRGLLSIHGQVHTPEAGYGAEWYVTASILKDGAWISDRSKFRIGTPGIHVCDPHVVRTPDGSLLMSVSFDQGSTSLVKSDASLASIFTAIGGK